MISSFRFSHLFRMLIALAGAFAVTAAIVQLLAPARVVSGTAAATVDLQIDKVGPDTAIAGGVLTYTIEVTNTSAQTLQGVIITDTWTQQDYNGEYTDPPGDGLNVMSTVLVTTAGQTRYIQFNLANLGPGAHGFIYMTMSVSRTLEPMMVNPLNGQPQQIVLGNSVVITTSYPGVSANVDTVQTPVVGPIFRLTKSVTPTVVRPGRLFTYTFKVENTPRQDSITATNMMVSETIPLDTLFVTASHPSLVTYFAPTRTVQWYLTSTLPVSAVTYLTLTLRVTTTSGYGYIANNWANCNVRSDAIPIPIPCDNQVAFLVDDVFEKNAVAAIPPVQDDVISKTFPNRIVTYTISVYNPYDFPVSDFVVTDTLPHWPLMEWAFDDPGFNPNPTQTFQYLGVVAHSPGGAPAPLSGTLGVQSWLLPTIGRWGVYTFTFRAFVPPQMYIPYDTLEKVYFNIVDGSANGTRLWRNDSRHDPKQEIKVVPQIVFTKTVAPPTQIFGLPVVYSLTVGNIGDTPITSLTITDVVPTGYWPLWCAFLWGGVTNGRQPITTGINMAAWAPITLPAYSQQQVAVFTSTVLGQLHAVCYDSIRGYSPDTYIQGILQAPVVVDVPFRYDKSVQPSAVIIGDVINYTVHEFNVGGIPAVMTHFTDTLPPGFLDQYGNPVYSETLPSPLTLLPNDASEYVKTFPVRVTAAPIPCDNLFNNQVYQEIGTFRMRIADPPLLMGDWYNSAPAAPVSIRPQVEAQIISALPGVLPGDRITFTLVLSNNTGTTYGGLRVTFSPGGFTYGGELGGTPVPIQTSPDVIWLGRQIPGYGVLTLQFWMTAPATVADYQVSLKAITDSGSEWLPCVPRKNLTVRVRLGIIEVRKEPQPRVVGPLSKFDYFVDLYNTGPYTVTVARFTDTLPGVTGHPFQFVGVPAGNYPAPVLTDPPVWANLVIPPNNGLVSLRFTVRVREQVGNYYNRLATANPAPLAGQMTATLPAKWIITTPQNYDGALLNVVPGVVLMKEVDTPAAIKGGAVVYTITLLNLSNQAISTVRITDTLPPGFVLEQVLPGTPLPQSPWITSTVVWTFNSVASGASQVLVFRARIAANQPTGVYSNRVEATSSSIYIEPTGDTAPVQVAGVPVLNLSKSVAPGAAIAGRQVTYTLTLANAGVDPVSNATLTDTLPAGFSFSGMIVGPVPSINGQRMIWTGVSVPPQTTVQYIFRALVAPGTPSATYYNQLDGSTPQVVFQSTGQAAPVNVVAVPTFDVQVSKTDGAYTATIGGSATYTIRYTNTFNLLSLTAQGVVLTETFAPAAYLSAIGPGWNPVASGVYTRLLGDLAAGTSGQVTFALQINPAIPQQYLSITNTVQIGARPPGGTPEAVEQPASNNSLTDVDTIRGSDIVVLGLAYQPANPRKGKPITVTVTLQNQGVDPTSGPKLDVNDPGGWFGADLYVKPNGSPPPTGPADRYLGLCPDLNNPCSGQRWSLYKTIKSAPGVGLASGETYAFTYTYVLPDSGVKWFYVQADTFWGDGQAYSGLSQTGRITEPNELNNVFGPVVVNVQGDLYLPLIRKNN